MSDQVLVDWLRAAALNCQWTASVWTGAGLYAAARLLDDKTTTTHWGFPRQPPRDENRRRRRPRRLALSPRERHRCFRRNRHGPVADQRVHGQRLAEALQLVIEYDAQPPFGSSSPAKADASTLRLAFASLSATDPCDSPPNQTGQHRASPPCTRAMTARVVGTSRGSSHAGGRT
jgi:hypothetical protein